MIQEKIANSEKLVAEMISTDFAMDISSIRKKSLSHKHEKELVSIYSSNVLNSYEKVTNYYKESFEAFDELEKHLDIKASESIRYREDFIAEMLFSMMNSEPDNPFDALKKEEILKELVDLENVVIETYTLKLKSMAVRNYLKNIESQYSQDLDYFSATDIGLLEAYLRNSGDYKKANRTEMQIHSYFANIFGGKSTANIQAAYNRFRNSENERTAQPSRIKKIITYLEDKQSLYPKSYKAAAAELEKAIDFNL